MTTAATPNNDETVEVLDGFIDTKILESVPKNWYIVGLRQDIPTSAGDKKWLPDGFMNYSGLGLVLREYKISQPFAAELGGKFLCTGYMTASRRSCPAKLILSQPGIGNFVAFYEKAQEWNPAPLLDLLHIYVSSVTSCSKSVSIHLGVDGKGIFSISRDECAFAHLLPPPPLPSDDSGVVVWDVRIHSDGVWKARRK